MIIATLGGIAGVGNRMDFRLLSDLDPSDQIARLIHRFQAESLPDGRQSGAAST